MNDGHQEQEEARIPTCQTPAGMQETELPGRPERPKEKKIIHFASGETLEEEDSEEEKEDEEEEEAEESSPKRSPFNEPARRTRFSFKKMAVLMGRTSLQMCDFFGKRLAAALGLNVAKYQYAVDQYLRDHKETQSRAAEGPVEPIQLSGRPAGSRYGATGSAGGTAAPPEKHQDSAEGCHNRGYREDEDDAK